MDQNITALLAALIGGFLSAGGGFLANYYIQSASRQDDKQKGIRNMIESVYKRVQQVEGSYQNILDLQEEYSQEKSGPLHESYDAYSAQSDEIAFNSSVAKEVDKIEESIKDIDLLVTLYLSPLENAYSKYQERVAVLTEAIKMGTSNPEEALSKEDLKKIGKQFQLSLSALLRKKGYSYL
jgi:hypothetical protein